LALGTVVIVALFYGLMTLVVGLPRMTEIQRVRDRWLSGVELWNTYKFADYDINVSFTGLPELQKCNLRSEVTLSVRNYELVGAKNPTTGETLPIGEAPCAYETLTVSGMFDRVRQLFDEFDPWRDSLGGIEFNPAFGFVSQVSYYKCSTLTLNRLFSNNFNAGCSDWVFIYVSRFRWYDAPAESSQSEASN
jgi:hypothetical protein